jgi:hypothetical protein
VFEIKAGFRVRHPIGDFIEIDVISVSGLFIFIELERQISHRRDVRTTVGGSSATRHCTYALVTSLAEVPGGACISVNTNTLQKPM